jgi:GT2 family glycosyltransferase
VRISVLTLVRGREHHLERMLEGCLAQTRPADEIIVALMQDAVPNVLQRYRDRVRYVHVAGTKLPLAAARNAAARASSGDLFVFLDVDCIPGEGYLAAAADQAGPERCLTGDCRYLAEDQDTDEGFEVMWSEAERHPARPAPGPGGQPLVLGEMTELWSLSFAVPRRAFEAVGGFDEDFLGYGGEDTDFAYRLGQKIPELVFVPGMRAVHQWHQVAVPPLQHFDDIIRNARLFRKKHGGWCMDYWLGQLEERGFIKWSADEIVVLKRPSGDDLQAAWQGSSVRFS